MNKQPHLNSQSHLKIKLVRSLAGCLPKHRATIASLGLKKLGSSVILPNNQAVQGMVRQVSYLIKQIDQE